jgi:hypothetical protein
MHEFETVRIEFSHRKVEVLAMTHSQSTLYKTQRSMFLVFLIIAVNGCATMHTQPHAFFLPEQDRETHGRKTWFDRLVEFDPGKIKVTVAADYAQNPPRRIAVLPFVDHGSAQFVVNKIPLTFRNAEEQETWAWTYANRLRRALTGYLAQREFVIVNLHTIDTILADHGITDWDALQAVPPPQLAQWLRVDAVVYGQVNHYEAYYAFLVANWRLNVDVRMVATEDGHEFFTASGSRYSVDLRPAFSLMDVAINSALTLLQLRDVNLARAEDEVGREIVLRLPVAETNVATLVAEARTPSESGELLPAALTVSNSQYSSPLSTAP